MTLHIEIECDLCGVRKSIIDLLPVHANASSVFIADIERLYIPPGWAREEDPKTEAVFSSRIPICEKCQAKIKEVARKVDEIRDRMLEEALNPPTPRLERDEEMRKKERVLKANGGFK